jgi:hypothetical protein
VKLTERKPKLPGWRELPVPDDLRKKLPESICGYSAWQNARTCVVSSLNVDPINKVQCWMLSVSRVNASARKNIPAGPNDIRRALRAFEMEDARRDGVVGVCVLYVKEFDA